MTKVSVEMTADLCPLCGQGNACDQARAEPTGQCWCLTTEFDARVKQLLPNLDAGICICQRCAEGQGVNYYEG